MKFAPVLQMLLVCSSVAVAQHEGMNMPGMRHDQAQDSQPLIAQALHHATTGTTAEPESESPPMLMWKRESWRFMFHGAAFVTAQQQSGPRSADKVFSTSWFMPMAQRNIGKRGQITFRTMLSLEPATVTGRFYPEMFQQGETAFGRPINDGQHPHDLFMEIAALYDLKLRDDTVLTVYAAPMGDPALGPAAFPHRASASEDPLAPLGHHLQDSTHIAADVLTLSLTHKFFRIEASGFHGREPDENRWNIEHGAIDSWSTRLTVNPAKNWSAQYSFGRLTSPEALHPDEDTDRMTASVMYNRPIAHGEWSSMLLWGRNSEVAEHIVWNGYLAESTLRFTEKNRVWTRIENVDRTNELLLGRNVEPPGFADSVIGRVQAYSLGYDRELPIVPHLSSALGAQVTWYGVPDSLTPIYGKHPAGVAVFLRFRPASSMHH
jgi:hypothetical protein